MVAFKLLEKLEILKDFEITISFSRNIPIGKGLSSSTADMLSTIRALQEVFGFLLRNNTISEIFTSIEPHDGLMHKSSVVYDHRKGRLINDLKYIPQYWIIGVDFGGEVNTVKYNKHLKISEREVEQYDQLYDKLIESFSIKDDIAIADCATRSCKLYCERTKDNNRVDLLNIYRNFDSLGVVNTHSGTCVGLLYPGNLKVGEISKIAKSLKKEINLSVFVTHTLKLLN